MQKYDMTSYSGLVAACKSGNLKLYEDELSDPNQFIQDNSYLFIVKLKCIVLRNLLKSNIETDENFP